MKNQTLLIELLTEELPPKALKNLGCHFAASIAEGLAKLDLIISEPRFIAYATPRRLAVQIVDVAAEQSDRTVIKKGPARDRALDENGKPTAALEGFMRSCGNVGLADLTTLSDGKKEVYAYEFTQKGSPLALLLEDVLNDAVKKLPIPKVMRWGSSTHTFVRPVHHLTVLYGEDVLPVSILGLTANRITLGHRFLSSGAITLKNADGYADQLRHEGCVIASFEERKALIQQDLNQAAQKLGARIAADESLLDEVSALVEYPVVLKGDFESRFLHVPQECLILTMQQNQKYFPLLDQKGKLINHFLLVSNHRATDGGKAIIHGNEKVLRARLSDAEFFYTQDKKHRLDSRLDKLESVVYHNKIGSQGARVVRLMKIAEQLALQLGASVEQARRAAQLAKADLVTEMVGEFPELQGIMGHYYALIDGEEAAVAHAIEQHYYPRFAGDKLPESVLAATVALAEKLETLVGIWGIGLKPTGDKDPYALRRAALGVVRILMQYPASLKNALQAAFDVFPNNLLDDTTVEEVAEFCRARLAILLEADYAQDVVAAVLAHQNDTLEDVHNRLNAVAHFKNLPEAQALAAAHKRVHNLLKKNEYSTGSLDQSLLIEPAEKDLFNTMNTLEPTLNNALRTKQFSDALTALATLKPTVDAFFADVMVMADDLKIRNNRLHLLAQLENQLNAVADIGLLQTE